MRQVAGRPVEREMHRARIGLTFSRQDEKDVQPEEMSLSATVWGGQRRPSASS